MSAFSPLGATWSESLASDPLAEMVSLALFGEIGDDPAFVDGYRAAGGALVLDGRARQRLALYRSYLYLIMLVEAVPRGAEGPTTTAPHSTSAES